METGKLFTNHIHFNGLRATRVRSTFSFSVLRISVLATLILISACSEESSGEIVADLAVRNVDVFDSQTGTVAKDKTILINGDTIHAIIDVAHPIYATEIIEGNDRLVTPGFIDTHAHLMVIFAPESLLPFAPPPEPSQTEKLADQYLRHGTTTIMDMGQAESWLDTSLHWQANPSPDFPNVFVAGASLISESEFNTPPHWVPVSADTIEEKLTNYKARGIDRLKLYRVLTLDDMQAVVRAADELGFRYYAHTDNNVVTIPEAIDLGVRDFEHFFTVIPSVLDFRQEQRVMFKEYGLNRISNADEYSASLVLLFNHINNNPTFKQNLDGLFDQMAKHNATISTALNVLASGAKRASFYCSLDPVPGQTEPDLTYTVEQEQLLSESFDVMMGIMKAAHDRGVALRIGTDCWYGGKALLSELALLIEAGISPADTLKIATWNGAEALDLEDQLGHIAPGKMADLIIFDTNPLNTVDGLTGQKTVIKGGKVYQD